MTSYKEILRLSSLGISNRKIAVACGCSRTTVQNILSKSRELGLSWPTVTDLSDKDLWRQLFPKEAAKPGYKLPDFEYVHREMAKSGVTLSLLWLEYCDQCREVGEIPYKSTQFNKYYGEYAAKTKATMHINRKPGEIMEVDWAGTAAALIDTDTGGIIPAHVFVAALPYSGYAYVEAFLKQDQGSWITAHNNAYRFFGGVTRILVPDNLKTGVEKHSKSEVIINKAYQEMAEHYGTAVIPARVRSPKDKATVEGAVGLISTWILAALRNQQFLSLPELNRAIKVKLTVFLNKQFQKKEGSRAILFAEEKAFLLPLPGRLYELASWKIAIVQYNYHVSIEGQNYSVSYEYIKHKVDVRITENVIEIFFEGHRICSHPRLKGRPGQYSTLEIHMPPNHRKYAAWDGDRFRTWAARIGVNTSAAVQSLLERHKVEQQGYKACMAILKLTDKYPVERLEASCELALSYTAQPSYKNIAAILRSGHDRLQKEVPVVSSSASEYGFTRGADYYKRRDGK
ncbi:MAG: IS21 family transposase [Candidatus Adiutrix sp.]|jgi:transposase|nr:IS21 family transposase [Candidatus Adiutrix sp.]